MQIERVSIDDVYPVEDERGNQFLSRDYSLKENQRYVEELAASFNKETGEPDEPPVLVRDGGIYRIKAGNSRIMAMREIGTKTFTAIIDEKDTPQSLVEAAIRTDTKKTYEEIERSRFEQQLFLFGTDEYVSETTGRSVEDVKKVRRTIQNVEDAAEDMTIERMIALAEFEGEDDQDAYLAIVNAKEKNWRKVANDERVAKTHRERRRALGTVLDERGIESVEEIPNGYSYLMRANCASGIPADCPEGTVSIERYVGGLVDSVTLYEPAQMQTDPEEEAQKARIAELEDLFEKTQNSRLAWFLEHWTEDLHPVRDLLDDRMDAYSWQVKGFMELHGIQMPTSPAETARAFVQNEHRRPHAAPGYPRAFPGEFMAFTDALKECGYEPCPEEVELYQMAADSLEEDAA